MEIKITNQNNYKYTTPKFKAKAEGANLLSLLTKSFGEIKSKCTQGHFDNIYFKTNLNDVLRNPDAQIVDQLQYMAMSYMPNSVKNCPKWLKNKNTTEVLKIFQIVNINNF